MPGDRLWVARDDDGYLAFFVTEPKVMGARGWCTPGHPVVGLAEWLFPDIQPGECRRVTLTPEAPDAG